MNGFLFYGKNFRQDQQDCQDYFLTIFRKKMVKSNRLRRIGSSQKAIIY